MVLPLSTAGDDANKGFLLAIASGVLITCNDVVIKLATGGLPLGQIMATRGAMVLIVLLFWIALRGRPAQLKVHDKRGVALRALTMVFSTIFFLKALSLMAIAEATALVFIAPIFATAAAVPLLGERVGWRRWSAVFVGLIGVLIVIRPGTEAFVWAAAFPIMTALCSAARDILTRRLSRSDSSLAIVFYTTLAVTLAGVATLPFGWVVPSWYDLGLLCASTMLIVGAHMSQVEALRFAEVSLLTPTRYLSLVWAMLLGFFVWGDVPDRFLIAGSVLIVGAGAFVWLRERQIKVSPAAGINPRAP